MKLSAFFGHNIARESGGGARRRDEPKAEQIIVLRSRILRNYCLEGLFHTVPSSFVLHCTCKRTQQFTMLHLFAWGKKFDRFQTLRNNSQQHATICNRVCKRTEHATSNSTGSCWPTLSRPFTKVFYRSKLLWEKKSTCNVKIS